MRPQDTRRSHASATRHAFGYFCNVPTRLADALGAAQFRFETLARLGRYYKARCGQQKIVMDQIRNEIEAVKELKRCAVGLQPYGNLDIDIQ